MNASESGPNFSRPNFFRAGEGGMRNGIAFLKFKVESFSSKAPIGNVGKDFTPF